MSASSPRKLNSSLASGILFLKEGFVWVSFSVGYLGGGLVLFLYIKVTIVCLGHVRMEVLF